MTTLDRYDAAITRLQDQVRDLVRDNTELRECLGAVGKRINWYFECRDRIRQPPTIEGLSDMLRDVSELLFKAELLRIEDEIDVAGA